MLAFVANNYIVWLSNNSCQLAMRQTARQQAAGTVIERAVQSIFVIFFQWVVPGYQEQYIKKIQYSKNDKKYTFQVGKSQKMHFLEQILDKYDVEVLRDLVGLLFLRSYLLCSSFKQKLTTLACRKLSVLLRSRQTQSQ